MAGSDTEPDHDEDRLDQDGCTPRAAPLPLAREFVESAKDTGDSAAVALARRVWWAVHFPRARPCAPQEMEIFREWCAAA